MRLERLQVSGLRCLEDVSVVPGAGLNMFVGPNGAGKTSLLEAVYLLSHGRSFRGGARDAMLRRGAARMDVFGATRDARGNVHRLGLGRADGRWSVHVDGVTGVALSGLLEHCAVVCFEPGGHALIAGGAEERRRFVDWGVFHVEHAFLGAWQRYQRALKQRNALLRGDSRAGSAQLEPWEREMGRAAAAVDRYRATYMAAWEPRLQAICGAVLPELGDAVVTYRRGWDAGIDLDVALARRRERDYARGHTTAGPHRADWRIAFTGAPQREHLSRGQQKLCALACQLAQAELYAAQHDAWPILCMDDLESELDRGHQQAVVDRLLQTAGQVWVTGTRSLAALPADKTAMFHVEHGRIHPA